MTPAVLLEALAGEGRCDAEATDVPGEYRVGGSPVRVETTARRVVVYAGQARLSLPRAASSGMVARAVLTALSTRPEAVEERLPFRLVAGRRLYLAQGPRGRALVLAASAGTALALATRKLGVGTVAYQATEDEDGRHEAVLCEDGVERPIARVLSALASVR